VTVPPEAALEAAFKKARDGSWWRLVSHQPDQQCWYCPSRTTPGEFYVLRVRPGSQRGDEWYWRLTCSCPAESSGKYLACWHKAACYLKLTAHRLPVSGDSRSGSAR